MPIASTSESSAKKKPIKVTKTKTGKKRSAGRRSASLASAEAHEPRDHPHREVHDVIERGDAGLGRRGIGRHHAGRVGAVVEQACRARSACRASRRREIVDEIDRHHREAADQTHLDALRQREIGLARAAWIRRLRSCHVGLPCGWVPCTRCQRSKGDAMRGSGRARGAHAEARYGAPDDRRKRLDATGRTLEHCARVSRETHGIGRPEVRVEAFGALLSNFIEGSACGRAGFGRQALSSLRHSALVVAPTDHSSGGRGRITK